MSRLNLFLASRFDTLLKFLVLLSFLVPVAGVIFLANGFLVLSQVLFLVWVFAWATIAGGVVGRTY